MRKLKMMHDCIQQISQLVELNGGMIDQMNKDDKIDLWWFKMEEKKREKEKLQIQRRRLAIDEQRNSREKWDRSLRFTTCSSRNQNLNFFFFFYHCVFYGIYAYR